MQYFHCLFARKLLNWKFKKALTSPRKFLKIVLFCFDKLTRFLPQRGCNETTLTVGSSGTVESGDLGEGRGGA